MKKLIRRAQRVVGTSKSQTYLSLGTPDVPPAASGQRPDMSQRSSSPNQPKAGDSCVQVIALAQSIDLKWQWDPQCDLTSDMRELWCSFCNAGMQPSGHQQLIDFLRSITKGSSTEKNIVQGSQSSPWESMPHFKPIVEQKLQEAFTADLNTRAPWISLNNLLARISLPPESIYDLRMACLWNVRTVLETSDIDVTVDMLKILMLWLGGHIHWLQLQILRAHSENHPADTLVVLELGDLPAKIREILRPIVDFERLRYWRQRLQEVHDERTSDASTVFYTIAVLQLLEVGIAEIDQWKEELPAA